MLHNMAKVAVFSKILTENTKARRALCTVDELQSIALFVYC